MTSTAASHWSQLQSVTPTTTPPPRTSPTSQDSSSQPRKMSTLTTSPPPPLLLTKPLTQFLHDSLLLQPTPTLQTALLTTSRGKLLAYANYPQIPVSTLRTQATVAATLFGGGRVGKHGEEGEGVGGEGEVMAVQLDARTGVMVRRLGCGLLVICMGPVEQNEGVNGRLEVEGAHDKDGEEDSESEVGEEDDTAAGDEVTRRGKASKLGVSKAMQSRAEEMARALDASLAGLRIPDDGV